MIHVKPSQNEQILRWLKRGKSLTALQAFKMCGSLALHSRAAELRKHGHDIKCEVVRVGDRIVGRYSLR